MKRLLFALFVATISLLYALEDTNASDVKEQKVLYISYDYIPSRIIQGEVFFVTIKALSVIQDIEDIEYVLEGARDLQILNDAIPHRKREGRYYYDTFYFKALGTHVRLPDIRASVVDYFSDAYKSAFLEGKEIEAIRLNPREDFCGIIAKDFTLVRYKTTTYDDTHNIVVFVAEAKQTFLKDFRLQNVVAQGFESLNDTITSSRMIYYAVIDKKEENLVFSYFNTVKNDYVPLSIPIIVEEDSVTTQSDLKPKDQSKQRLKMFVALSVVLFGVVMLLWRQRYIYILFIALPAVYIVYLLIPQEKICIKAQTKIRILPLENSTVFEITDSTRYLDAVGKTEDFYKVELENQKIGWVKNEDICDY